MLLFFGTEVLAQSEEKGLLWEITGNDLDQPSYIFGTIHIICPDDFILKQSVVDALRSCGRFMMEIDMSDPTLMSKMQQLSVNPGMKNISSEMDKRDSLLIDAFLVANYGTGLQQFGILKPFVLLVIK